jgi:4-amino-4-deoxy-L-arabinose transferase-like glycosyltransferase
MSRRKRRVIPNEVIVVSARRTPPPWVVTAALVLAGIPFVLGKYMEFNSPDPFDSGAYVYSAHHLLQGARLGVDEAASAQPGTLLVNVIGVAVFGFNETGPKLIQALLQAAALVLMFHTVRRLYGAAAAVVSTAIASIYLSAPVIAKYGNVKEQYMIAFMVIAACCFLLYQKSGRWWLAVCAAAAAVSAYYFKPTGISVVVAITVYVLAQPLLKNRSWRDTACDFMLLISGAIIGLVPMAVFHLWQGQSEAFLTTAPVRGILFAITILTLSWMGVVVVRLWRRYEVWRGLGQVRPWIWIAGAAAMLLVFTPFAIYFIRTGDLLSYMSDIAFIKAIPWAKLRIDMVVLILRMTLQGYVGEGWAQTSLSQVAPQILRYYGVLILPIALAAAAVVTALARWTWRRLNKTQAGPDTDCVVLLLAVWWILDMGSIWISPRSYEQYYLPLNASAAVLAGCLVGLFARGFGAARNKMPWAIGGVVCVFVAIALVWPIFAGQTRSPDTGADYGGHRRGYAQRLDEARKRRSRPQPWEAAGDYIRGHTNDDDVMYVWGWVPGIYVRAQRLCPAPNAFESEMHVVPPGRLASKVRQLLDSFAKRPPRFIVDSRKRHFPPGRPPLELWPRVPAGFMGAKSEQFLPTDPQAVAAYDQAYTKMLAERVGPAEAKRHAAMAPFRNYVMSNYSVVGTYGEHVLFVRKTAPSAP